MISERKEVPVLQIIGYKNSGKTTLSCKLIAALSAKGIRVGSAKHDAHSFKLDDPDTDSWKHLASGAKETVLTSQEATRIMRKSAVSLSEIAEQMYGRVDLIIAEGFKTANYPKIALIRQQEDAENLLSEASHVKLAIGWDASIMKENSLETPSSYSEENIPLISIHDEEAVLEKSISLALSLLSSTSSHFPSTS